MWGTKSSYLFHMSPERTFLWGYFGKFWSPNEDPLVEGFWKVFGLKPQLWWCRHIKWQRKYVVLTDFIVIQSGIFIFGCSCAVGWLNKLTFFLLNVLHVVIKNEKEYLVIYCGIMATTTHAQPITRSNIFVWTISSKTPNSGRNA